MTRMKISTLFTFAALFFLSACGDSTDRNASEAIELLPDARPGVVEDRFVRLALSCVHKEYPNKISHVLGSDEDARTPRQLTPVF
jgi:Protein of unknown function (DUF2891)